MKIITKKYLRENPNHIFVFGDNTIRKGRGGGASLRDEPNTYGFITKKIPFNNDKDFYKPNEYKTIFAWELEKLLTQIRTNPDKLYLISKIGNRLANRFNIFEKVIEPNIKVLALYDNVKFLW